MDTPNAVLLIDYENIYYFFEKQVTPTAGSGTGQEALGWLRRLRAHLTEKVGEQVISLDAYADFERLPEDAQGDLYLLGAETHHVVGTDHKNAADMRLCIDALEILYTRPNIASFVLAAGDRDYIPLLRHLRKQGKTVRVVGFPGAIAGDLLTAAGPDNFLDGRLFLAPPPVSAPQVTSARPKPVKTEGPKRFNGELTPTDHDRQALGIIAAHFPGKPEIWLTPYLHKLRAELPGLAEFERRELINRLEQMKAVAVEKREGQPNPFSVLILNWNHPLVREVCGGA